ncbi:hypothetical protein GCM10025866_16630 [Naasia aerilata]|uniref:Calcineurin-like phosphoesterase domain-containing protein n=1 Tax=Naasia aerilata TaxID=1162966 RepID=A0ABN6XLC5_9MICO|nr:hypothetical protein GCM10025866_16630 [Naasia aerilata]
MLRLIRRAAALTAAAGAAAFAYGSLVERDRFTLRRATVPILPAGAKPIRVLHLSDLHMAPWQRGKQEFVRSLATLKPDLVVTTGDNLGHERGIEGLREALAPFAGVPGVYVWGSNDYFGPEPKNPFSTSRVPRRRPSSLAGSTSRGSGSTSRASAGPT